MYDRVLCFVNCHFAAHLEAVNRRNADFDHVFRTMTFSRQSTSLNSGVGMLRNLFLSCCVACSAYYFLPIHWSLLLLVSSIAAGASFGVSVPRGGNVCIFFDWYSYCHSFQRLMCNLFKKSKSCIFTGCGCQHS